MIIAMLIKGGRLKLFVRGPPFTQNSYDQYNEVSKLKVSNLIVKDLL